MNKIRLKFLLVTIIFIVIFYFLGYFVNSNVYDHILLKGIFNLKPLNNEQKKIHKSYVLSFGKNQLSNDDFDTLINLFHNFDTKSIVIDDKVINKNDLKIEQNKKIIINKGLLKRDKNFLFKKFNYYYDKELLSNFIFLKNNSGFSMANYQNDLFISANRNNNNVVSFFVTYNDYNFDFIYKLENRYVYSIPFLLFLNSKNINFDEIVYSSNNINLDGKKFSFDSKGRLIFLNSVPSFIERDVVAFDVQDYIDNLKVRKMLVENLINLGIIDKNEYNKMDFASLENLFDTVYSIDPFKDKEKNSLLNNSKDLVLLWKSFREQVKNSVNDKFVFLINSDSDISYVKDTMKYLYVLENNKFVNRLSYFSTYSIVYLVAVLVLLITYNLRKRYSLIIYLTLFVLNFIFYYIFINVFNLYYPFFSFLVMGFLGFSLGLLLKWINFRIWRIEVRAILGNSISNNYCKELAIYLRNNEIEFKSGIKDCTFVYINLNNLLKNDTDESLHLYLNKVINDIEKIIKDDNGVVTTVLNSEIICYFGLFDTKEEHLVRAINVVNKIIVYCSNNPELFDNIFVSVVNKKELFDYIDLNNEKIFRNVGNSITYLRGVNKVCISMGVKVCVTSSVVKKLLNNKKFAFRMFDRVKIAGINQVDRIFQFASSKDSLSNELIDYFHAGLKLFEAKMWEESSYYFKQCLKLSNDDKPSKIYLERALDFIYIPPKENWDGVYEVD